MKHYWELAQSKVEAMPLRERMIMFAAMAFAVIALTSKMLLDPLMAKQKALSAKLEQQQGQMKELQVKVQVLSQAKKDEEHSPLLLSIEQLKKQVEAQQELIKDQRNHLVEPDKIVSLLQQVLNKNGKLQWVALENLPVILVPTQAKNNTAKQIFKHGVKITLRGGYLDLLQYLAELEKTQVHLYWGDLNFKVVKYPEAELILTLYTLSLDRAWLKV